MRAVESSVMSGAQRLSGSVGMFEFQGHGPTSLGSLLLCCGALLLPKSSLKQGKRVICLIWNSSLVALPGCPAQVELCHSSVSIKCPIVCWVLFFFLICAYKTCKRLKFLSAKEMH